MPKTRRILLATLIAVVSMAFATAAWFAGRESGMASVGNTSDDDEEYQDYVERRRNAEEMRLKMARWDERYWKEYGKK